MKTKISVPMLSRWDWLKIIITLEQNNAQIYDRSIYYPSWNFRNNCWWNLETLGPVDTEPFGVRIIVLYCHKNVMNVVKNGGVFRICHLKHKRNPHNKLLSEVRIKLFSSLKVHANWWGYCDYETHLYTS